MKFSLMAGRASGPAWLLASALALTTGLTSQPSAAQTSAENVAAARALGVEGIRLADSGNCSAAIEKLERAEALYHAPTTLGRLGECQVALGQLIVGTENLNRVVRETLAPGAPRAFVDAQERARKVLDSALPKIAQLTITVEPAGVQASVTVDNTPLPGVLLGAARPTDPGTHEVRATAPGHLPAVQSVTLVEGGTADVKLVLTPDPNAGATPPPAPAAPPPAAPETSSTSSGQLGADVTSDRTPPSSRTAAFVLFGIGGAGLVTGSVFGLIALSKKGDLECPGKTCAEGSDDEDTLDSAKSMALISTIGFGVGIAGAAAGTVLLLTSEDRASARVPKLRIEYEGVAAEPWVGYGSAGVTGTF